MLKEYLKNIQELINQGDAREESYYIHLDALFKTFAVENKINNIDITILPKKTEAGNPDFRIWDGKSHITGYIEAKAPTISNLDRIEESEQVSRYRETFPNLILTNFFEFRLYRNGELIKKTIIARQDIATKLATIPPIENKEEFYELLNTFFSFSLPKVLNSNSLAEELAKRTRFLRDEVISIELANEERKGQKAIFGFYEAFKQYLIGTLTPKAFADLYSQTVTYGLFAARTRASETFNRELAFKYIPNTIGILRDIFRFISLEDPPKPLQIIVDDIAEVLNVTDVKNILNEYKKEGKGQDPIIHFYENFLTKYDPEIREMRGVYYTPEPVVVYIVRVIHQLLKTHFNISDGIAGENVTMLDPAAGTLTFPAEAIKIAIKEYTDKYGSGGKSKFIANHILKNFFAFELMMAPYAIGHIKMSLLLEELGYNLNDDERFKLYLTNTLDMEELQQIQIPGLISLSEESHSAGEIKKHQDILVIFGNPPYSGISLNPGEINSTLKKGDTYVSGYYWSKKKNCVEKHYSTVMQKEIKKSQKTYIGEILMDYYFVDGKSLDEKKLWLQDDYVKFIRFAQWKIQNAGFGIVGMITNHSYLDNPTFRGMRQSLMNTFNEIYIINLHGNSLKKETCPDGSKDENVFAIRQGTAIVIFVKKKNINGCQIYYKDLFGLRDDKFKQLIESEFNKNEYSVLKPESPWYFFIPRDTDKIKTYLNWKAIKDIFPINVSGIVTARDGLAIDFNKQSLKRKISNFRNKNISDKEIELAYNVKNNYQWKIAEQREIFGKIENWEDNFEQIIYRPFDIRHIYYQDNIVFRTRKDVMRHLLYGDNLSICFVRQFSGNVAYSHSLITNCMVNNRAFFSAKGIIQQAPLYLYKEKLSKRSKIQAQILFNPEIEYNGMNRTPNIDADFYETLSKIYKEDIKPEEILYYVYAILYSNVYRQKYAEYLKIDFPRIPIISDYIMFKKFAAFGETLAGLHLLNSPLLDFSVSKYQGENDNDKINKIEYSEKEQRIYINDGKYFDNVGIEVWNYQIGGYQVLDKYLRERKDSIIDVPKTFCRIVTALSKTIELQQKIDELYPELEEYAIE